MANLFKSVPSKPPKRNFFNLSHEVFTTAEMGQLFPIFCEPVVPGDSFQITAEALVRFAPQIAPFMSRVNVYTHFFFVPLRLIWSEFETFKTGGSSGTRTVPYPVFNMSNVTNTTKPWCIDFLSRGRLYDYLDFGVKDQSEINSLTLAQLQNFECDILPFRAYLKVWNDYYRDETFDVDLWDFDTNPTYESVLMGSNPVDFSSLSLSLSPYFRQPRYRAWEKDYFTSALPWSQRGGDVTIPAEIGINAPVTGLLQGSDWAFSSTSGIALDTPSNAPGVSSLGPNNSASPNQYQTLGTNYSSESGVGNPIFRISNKSLSGLGGSGSIRVENVTGLSAQQSIDSIGLTVNELRYAVAAQEFLEQMARGGSRYIEQNLSMFGVRSSDARLQRPEYLGGGVSPVVVSEVIQNSQSTESSAQGNMSGHAVSAQKTRQFRRFFEEDGIVIGIASIMPKASYIGGTPRKWLKRDRFDFYFPAFANLGEQEITNQELYTDFTSSMSPLDLDSSNNQTWGYTPRYAEYKFIPSRVHGDFTQNNFDFWHFGRKFTSLPSLGSTFIHEPPTNRVFAVQETSWNHCWCQFYLNILAKRPMPKYGVPKLK